MSDPDVLYEKGQRTVSRHGDKHGNETTKRQDERPTDPNARPACFRSTTQEVLFALTATMAIMMSSYVSGSVTVITSFVGRDLNMTNAEIAWISAANSLAAGAFLLPFARVADLFGRKAVLLWSLGLFAVISLGASFSQNAITLSVLSGFMGLVSACAVPAAVGILGAAYEKPSKRKNYAFACFSAGNPLGFVFGTIFSGIATQLFSWRASFWLIAIIYVFFTIIAIFFVPKDESVKDDLSAGTLKKFDILGTLLIVGGVGTFSSSLSLASTAPDGWGTPYVLTLLILGILALVSFVVWETYCAFPLVPMGIWRDSDFSLLISILVLGFMGFANAAFWQALYMQRVWHDSSLEVAVQLLPMAIMGILVNIFAGLVLHRTSNKLLMGIGAAGYFVSFLLFALQKTGDSYWAFAFPGFVLSVVGADLEFNVANMYVMSSLPSSQQSVAGGIFQTATRLCATVGLGASTAIFNAVQSNPTSTGFHAGDPVQPYAAIFWFAAATSGLSLLLVPLLKIRTQGELQEESEERKS